MEEENKNAAENGGTMSEKPLLGKFQSVDALLHAYGELEAEFTRRSQRLKALEGELMAKEAESQEAAAQTGRAEPQEAVRVPLMGAGGSGVVAPKARPVSIEEAGALALGYLKRQKQI